MVEHRHRKKTHLRQKDRNIPCNYASTLRIFRCRVRTDHPGHLLRKPVNRPHDQSLNQNDKRNNRKYKSHKVVALRQLTVYESDFIKTNQQISLMMKTVLAQLTNSIVIPVITNIYIEDNIYLTNGLIYDIFYLSLTNALLPPLLKIIDLEHQIGKIMKCYYSRPCTCTINRL